MLIWTLFIDQFVPPVNEGGASFIWEYHFIRVHINLVQHPISYILIINIFLFLDELDQIFCGSEGGGFQPWAFRTLMDSCKPDHGYNFESPAIINLFQVS